MVDGEHKCQCSFPSHTSQSWCVTDRQLEELPTLKPKPSQSHQLDMWHAQDMMRCRELGSTKRERPQLGTSSEPGSGVDWKTRGLVQGKAVKKEECGVWDCSFWVKWPPLLLHPPPRNDKRAAPPAFPAPHTTRLQSRLSQTNAVTAAAMAGTCTVSVIPPPLTATYLS